MALAAGRGWRGESGGVVANVPAGELPAPDGRPRPDGREERKVTLSVDTVAQWC